MTSDAEMEVKGDEAHNLRVSQTFDQIAQQVQNFSKFKNFYD